MNYIEEELLRQARFWRLLTGDGADRREEGQPSERTAESAAETERAAESAARLREFPGLSAGNRRYAQPQSGGAEWYARAGADPEPAGAQAASPEMPDGAAQAGSAVSLRRAAGELSECVERDARAPTRCTENTAEGSRGAGLRFRGGKEGLFHESEPHAF